MKTSKQSEPQVLTFLRMEFQTIFKNSRNLSTQHSLAWLAERSIISFLVKLSMTNNKNKTSRLELQFSGFFVIFLSVAWHLMKSSRDKLVGQKVTNRHCCITKNDSGLKELYHVCTRLKSLLVLLAYLIKVIKSQNQFSCLQFFQTRTKKFCPCILRMVV